MPLIKCPDCGNSISDAAPACIHCGRPMKETAAPPKLNAALTIGPCPKCGSTDVLDNLAKVVKEGNFGPISALILGGFASTMTKGRYICQSCKYQWRTNV
ncbi:zinc-ribbon domain-containing protein [Noviherbaspirillum sp. UKPF54]|nr:zinc-ribbon domain-containing protein [Noviherbaspirillum sp. UKPF54]